MCEKGCPVGEKGALGEPGIIDHGYIGVQTKKTIKRFALLPVRIIDKDLNIEYTIWLTHYYIEYTLVQSWSQVGETKQYPNGSTGYAAKIAEWVITKVYQK